MTITSRKQAILLAIALTPSWVGAASLFAPGDAIIAIDRTERTGVTSDFPGGENPSLGMDANGSTKYLNFAGSGSGFIFTANAAAAAQSFRFITGNDAPERDPSSYILYGTNSAITSTNNSQGTAESWTQVSTGVLSLPGARNTFSSPVSFANPTAYSSYKMVFPTITNSDLMQFSEIEFYDSPGAAGSAVLPLSGTVLGIAQDGYSDSRYPGGENPGTLLDGSTGTKYLNFGRDQSGFIIDPVSGMSIATSFEIWTANDADGRDPASYEIWGGSGDILSPNNSLGNDEAWTLISSGGLSLPSDRETSSGEISFANGTAYDLYRVVFPTLKNSGENSMQISGFQLYGNPVPEPGSAALAGLALLGLTRRRRA